MRYHQNMGTDPAANPSCARFCANICSTFIVGREQCFLDCLSCRGVQAREAVHGCITVTDRD